ncbi:MAG: glycosyltransferase family 2 protein [Clostridia bacterium]|nr:glycosyltransferase family 2 protein [Clostridia bacterium]
MNQTQEHTTPAVSVIIPVYNPGSGFARCVDSIRSQTLQDIELIFVDDLGGDGSIAYAQELAKADDRIRILRNERNAGPGVSRNRGIMAARGEYLAFVDADDYLAPEFLCLLYTAAKRIKARIARGMVRYVYEDGSECPMQGSEHFLWHIGQRLGAGRPLYALFTNGHFSAIYQREWIIGNDVRYGSTKNGEDTTFLLKACHCAQDMLVDDEAVYYYVQREGSLVHTISAARLVQQGDALRDQIDYILRYIPDPDPDYLYDRFSYPLQIHAAAMMNGIGEEAAAFLERIRGHLKRLPCHDQLTKRYSVLRALMDFHVNLASAPVRLMGEDECADVLLDALSRCAAFALRFPEKRSVYAWPFRQSAQKAFEMDAILRERRSPLRSAYRKRLMKILLCRQDGWPASLGRARRLLLRDCMTIVWSPRLEWLSKTIGRIHPLRNTARIVTGRLRTLRGRFLTSRENVDEPAAAQGAGPRVSVVLPVYNPGEGIKRCISSLQQQTLAEIEMIFVDDCGTDDAMEIVRRAAQQDPRIRILVNDVNSGSGFSRNRGMEAAVGEYVAFVDPDDYIGPDFVERLYRRAGKDRPDIVKGECMRVNMRGQIIPEKKMKLNDTIREGLRKRKPLYTLFTYNHWTAIYRRDFLIESGARYGSTRNAQDTTFLLRVCHAAKSIAFDDLALYYYAAREGSRMRDFSRERLDQELASVRERFAFLLTHSDDGDAYYTYVFSQIMYCLRLQETVAYQNRALGECFLREIQTLVRELPFSMELKRRFRSIRALMWFDANLATMPYRAQGVIDDAQSRVRIVGNWVAFICRHPAWGAPCRHAFKSVVRQVMLSEEIARETFLGRMRIRRDVRALVRQLPDRSILTRGSISMTLFVRFGIDSFRLNAWMQKLLFGGAS